ncbi:MAG TPA: UDP-N-acetylmuramoyl-tripeptide--D-alanyl-D-alanine ligase [Anaerolineales bacterium]|nr:UDP-N-acetylmuramoyl-tripeptide--D-alanyl-D-alanine ligase [Anaerolineales bacterium]
MRLLTLGTAVEALTGKLPEAGALVLTDAVLDSRTAIPGSLFVAMAGEHTDGHDHVAEAFQHGASVALIEREVGGNLTVVDLRAGAPARLPDPPLCLRVEKSLAALQQIARVWRAQLPVRVIGITGSIGKSTTKEITADLLDRRYRTLRNAGNLNNEIGLPLSLLRLTEAHERAVLEMGFYVPGEISLLCDIARPAVGVITNIGPVHLERAGTMEAIIAGKAELVEALPSAPEGVAILNHDDPNVLPMAKRTSARVFTYGLTGDADLWADQIEGLGLEGVRFVLHHGRERFHLRVPMLGQHSVHTALRAAAVGLAEGMGWDDILSGLQTSQTQLRLVAVRGPHGALLLDDTYNAAPASVLAALNLLGELDGRRIAVLGDMLELGAQEETGHRMVGARAAEIADDLIVLGTRARWIAQEAEKAGLSAQHISALATNQEVIDWLNGRIGAGDVVLIKGSRGMHMDEIVAALGEPSS